MQVTIELTDEQIIQIASQWLVSKLPTEPDSTPRAPRAKETKKRTVSKIRLGVSEKWKGLDDTIFSIVKAEGELKSRQIYQRIRKVDRYKQLPWGTLSGHLNGMLKMQQLNYTRQGVAYLYRTSR